jgi:hypothetical protein
MPVPCLGRRQRRAAEVSVGCGNVGPCADRGETGRFVRREQAAAGLRVNCEPHQQFVGAGQRGSFGQGDAGERCGARAARGGVRLRDDAVVGSVFPAPSALYDLTSTVIGGGGALLLHAICAKLLRIDESRVLVRSVAGRLGRLCCAPSGVDRQHVEDRPVAGRGHAQPGSALDDVAAEPGDFQAVARSKSRRVDDVMRSTRLGDRHIDAEMNKSSDA